MKERTQEASPRLIARMAGALYLLNIATSLIAFSGTGGHSLAVVSGRIATGCYIAVTILLYYLFKPVNRRVSLTAALFGLMGSAIGLLGPLRLGSLRINSLVFFGIYCVLLGYLILRSIFLPRILGVLMLIAGLGWLTFLSTRLAHYLSPYHYIAGGIGEGLLTVWLLAAGVNAQRWKEQVRAAGAHAGV